MSSRSIGLLLGCLLGFVILGVLFFAKGYQRNPSAGSIQSDATLPPISIVSAETNPVVGPPKVKLAVLVVFDQMRGDYIDRWKDLYSTGGFRRMQTEGVHFNQCYYPYGVTSTGPGHASILSGCSANKHGITNNDWFDQATATKAYCAGSERYEIIPAKPILTPSTSKSTTAKLAGSPHHFLSPTVGDVLKLATNGKSKVFGLSLKDRSALLPVGRKPDGAYWFDGRFVTSTYYRDSVHPWVADFNRSKVMDQWFEKTWTKFRPDLDYQQRSGPDEMPGEGKAHGRGITFPHIMTGGKKELGKEYYEAVGSSPYGNELLLAFTKACVVAERLGTHDTPDLLTVSFSSNDLVGHEFGPDSQEVLDITLRSDAILAELLSFLDEQVGKGNYAVALTADHGICPLPEVSEGIGRDAKRVGSISLLLGAERHLQSIFGKLDGGFEDEKASKKTTWIETIQAPWLYLNERLCAAKGVKKEDVAKEYVAWLRQQPDIFNAYSAEELLKPEGLDEAGKMMAKSYYPGRSGDIGVVLKPYYLVMDKVIPSGTSHGTPHDYDRYVPLMVYGPGTKSGYSEEHVTPQHAATVLSYYLGLSNPKDCEYVLPKTLLK